MLFTRSRQQRTHRHTHTHTHTRTAAFSRSGFALSLHQVAVEKKGKGGKTKLIAKTGGAEVRQWDIMKMMVPGACLFNTVL